MILVLIATGTPCLAETGTAAGEAAARSTLDYIWVLTAAFLVFMMQAGFMCLEAGIAPAKHSINVAIKNLGDFVVAVVVFWTIGFGLMFGISAMGLAGTSDFLISNTDTWRVTFFIFQSVFVGTAATINSGVIAGRTRFGSYLILSAAVSGLIYPIFGHWAWGGLFHEGQQGWLEALGFIDFAGSTVVHSLGAWVGLAGAIMVGPRTGKFNPDGTSNTMSPHNMTLAYLGTFLLFFGWFGFNGGSTLEASPAVAPVVLNTILAASFGCCSATAASWILSPLKRPEAEVIANGLLGGLVAITAGCASVSSAGAAVIGCIGGLATYAGLIAVEKTLRLDDVVGAIAVHGISGAWGTLAVGFFALPEHLGSITRLQLIGVQGLGVLSCFLWTFPLSLITMKLIDRITPLRVSREDEQMGLNVSEHGATSTLLDLARTMHEASASGNFIDVRHIDVEHGTENGDLAEGFNAMLDEIKRSFTKLKAQQQMLNSEKQRTENALRLSEQERSKADQLLTEIEQQRTMTAQTRQRHLQTTETYMEALVRKTRSMSCAMDDSASKTRIMISNIHHIADAINDTSSRLMKLAEKNHQGVLMTQEAAREITISKAHTDDLIQSAKEIGSISDIISGLADQTRMLSLNALITSANAGESGRQFTVVANEIRELAARSTRSTEQIQQQLDRVQDRITTVVSQIDTIADILTRLDSESTINGETLVNQSENLNQLNGRLLILNDDSRVVSMVLTEATSEVANISKQIKDTRQGFRKLYVAAPHEENREEDAGDHSLEKPSAPFFIDTVKACCYSSMQTTTGR